MIASGDCIVSYGEYKFGSGVASARLTSGWAESNRGFLPVGLAVPKAPELDAARLHFKVKAVTIEQLGELRAGLGVLDLGITEWRGQAWHTTSSRLVADVRGYEQVRPVLRVEVA